MEVLSCYDSGSILNKQQVSISLSETLKTFQTNASRIAAISL
jgi:large subunit ribosomal protein LP0